METKYFKNYDELACEIADTYDSFENKDEQDVSVVGFYEDIKEILKSLICLGYDIMHVTLEDPEFSSYKDEIILTLNEDGLWCENFKRDNRYIKDDSTVTYFSGNCNSRVIPNVEAETVYEFEVGEQGCDCIDCCGNKVCEDSVLKDMDNYANISVKIDGVEIRDRKRKMDVLQEVMNHYSSIDRIEREIQEFKKFFPWL